MLIMTKTQRFVIWLNGFLEACEENPNPEQVEKIKARLNDIFEHVAVKPTEVETKKESLQELGEKYKFQVNEGFPSKTNHWGNESGVLYRC